MRTAYLADQRRRGECHDPFLEADRRETAKQEAAAKRVHPTLHLPATTSAQPSTQVAGLITSSATPGTANAPPTSAAFPTPNPSSGAGLFFNTPASSAPTTSLFATPSSAAPTSSLFGAAATPAQTPLFGSSPASAFGSAPASAFGSAPSLFGQPTPSIAATPSQFAGTKSYIYLFPNSHRIQFAFVCSLNLCYLVSSKVLLRVQEPASVL